MRLHDLSLDGHETSWQHSRVAVLTAKLSAQWAHIDPISGCNPSLCILADNLHEEQLRMQQAVETLHCCN